MPRQEQTDEDRRAISMLVSRWLRDWDYARPYFDSMKGDYLAYKFYRDPNSHPYKYNPSIPLVFTLTENIVSTIFNTFFLKPEPLSVEPMEGTHYFNPNIRDEAIARQIQKATNAVSMHPDREFMLEKQDLDMETTVFGNGYTMTVPVFDPEETSDIGGQLYLGPKVMHVSVWDLIPDREAYRVSNARRLWHLERNISKEELKRRIERENYLPLKDEEIEKLFGDKNWIPEDYHDDLLKTIGKSGKELGGVDTKDGSVLLLHCYDMETGHYKTLAGNRLLVRNTIRPQTIRTRMGNVKAVIKPFPYCPYDDIRLWPFPKEWYAMGVGAIAKGFQSDINLLKSMRLENIELAIHKVFLMNGLYDVDVDDVYMIPGGVIPVNDVDKAIKVLDVGDITRDAYTEQAMWQAEAQDASSSQEITRGNQPTRRETATTVVQLQRNAMKRLDAFMKRSSQWYKSVALKKIIQIRTYMSQGEYERLLGEPDAGFYQLSIGEIKRMFDLKPSSSSLEQIKEIEQQNFVNALQLMQGQEDMFNKPELARLFFELFFPGKNPDKYVLSPQQQQMMAQQQAPQGAPEEALPGGAGVGQPTINPAQIIQGAMDGSLGGQQGAV